MQKRQSLTINRNDKSTSISTQLDSLIPASKISTLTQGIFVAAETKTYKKIPVILSFVDENGEDQMKAEIEANYRQIKRDIVLIIESELQRIKNDPDLQHLVQEG